MQTIELNNGYKMPLVGLGTWQANDGYEEEQIITAINVALEAGYRVIDTAYLYTTEKVIGKVLKEWFDSCKLKREDVFIITKLPSWGNREESVEKYLKESLEALQLSYLDLYLIHHPVGVIELKDGDNIAAFHKSPQPDNTTDHISIWKAMEKQVDAGRVRSIGLSNFNSRQIKRVYNIAQIKPVYLQLECHLYMQQQELIAFCSALDIAVCAFGPVGSPALNQYMKTGEQTIYPLSDPVVLDLSKKYKRTPAQILLRHLIQKNIAVIPKSSNAQRIKENIQVFDFEISVDDIEKLNGLDKGRKGRMFTDKIMPGYLHHPENPFIEPY